METATLANGCFWCTEVIVGDARKVIPTLKECFDAIFIDAEKPRVSITLWLRVDLIVTPSLLEQGVRLK